MKRERLFYEFELLLLLATGRLELVAYAGPDTRRERELRGTLTKISSEQAEK